MKIDRTIILWIILGLLIIYAATCSVRPNGDFPGLEYMPDMGHSRAYDTYYPSPGAASDIEKESGDQQVDLLFADGKVAREPVAGTVARGFKPYPYQNTDEGYQKAGLELINPYAFPTDADLEQGKKSYTVYCGVCHGEKGLGKGSISSLNNGPFAGVINYMSSAYLQMEEGKMFHSVHFGKGNMGSYASQLTQDERWKVIAYIKSMQAVYAAKENKLSKEEAAQFVRGAVANLKVGGSSVVTEVINEIHATEDMHQEGHKDDHSNNEHH